MPHYILSHPITLFSPYTMVSTYAKNRPTSPFLNSQLKYPPTYVHPLKLSICVPTIHSQNLPPLYPPTSLPSFVLLNHNTTPHRSLNHSPTHSIVALSSPLSHFLISLTPFSVAPVFSIDLTIHPSNMSTPAGLNARIVPIARNFPWSLQLGSFVG